MADIDSVELETGIGLHPNITCIKRRDQASDATSFVEFMLQALLAAMQEVVLAAPNHESTAPSRHQVGAKLKLTSDQLFVFEHIEGEMSLVNLMALLNRKDRTKFRQQILAPLI